METSSDLLSTRLPALAAMAFHKIAFSVDEAALLSSWSRPGLYRAIAAGRLRAARTGRRTIILRQDLEDFLRAQRDRLTERVEYK
jgi:excisionase family DNA binding protein